MQKMLLIFAVFLVWLYFSFLYPALLLMPVVGQLSFGLKEATHFEANLNATTRAVRADTMHTAHALLR